MQKVRLLVKGSKRGRTPPKCAAIPWGCRGVVRWVRPAAVAWVEEERWTSEWRELEWDREQSPRREVGQAKWKRGEVAFVKKGELSQSVGGMEGEGENPEKS